MNQQRKLAALTLLALLVGTCIMMANVTSAQSIAKPAVPEFTLKYILYSRDVPATSPVYTIDPYTGQKEIQTPSYPGYHEDIKTVEIKIKNQPFTPYDDGNYHYIALFFNISFKGHFENEWHTFYNSRQSGGGFPQKSNSDYTYINFSRSPNDGGTIEFRIQAQIGYYTEYHMPYDAYYFTGQTSGWSNIKTIEIPTSTVSPTPVPPSYSTLTTTPSPTTKSNPTEVAFDSPLSWLLVGVVVGLGAIVALLAVVVVFMRNRINVLERKQNGT